MPPYLSIANNQRDASNGSFSVPLAHAVTGNATGATIPLYFNHLPTAQDDRVTVNEDSVNNSINVLSNDSTAPDSGESLTIVSVGAPNAGGAVTTNGALLTNRSEERGGG